MQDAINYQEAVKTIQIETSFNTLIRQLEASASTLESLTLSLVGKVLISIISLLLLGIILFAAYVRFGMSRLIQPDQDFENVNKK
jgi:Zn-dependent membrane protease YugP